MTSERLTAMRIKAAARSTAGPAVTQILVEVEAAEPLTDRDRTLLVDTIIRSLGIAHLALMLRGHRGLISHDSRVINGPLKGDQS